MSGQEIRTSWVKVANDNLEIDAYLAEPVGEGAFPNIVVIQEIMGVNSHIRDVTERIAKEGYVAIAPAMFQRVAPGFDVGYNPDDMALGMKYVQMLKTDEILSDFQATIAYLKTLPNVKKDAIGSIGFCFGGHVVYRAAADFPDIKATACFYGGGITKTMPGGCAPTISYTSEIKGTIYAFFGTQDSSIPVEQVDQIEAELQKHHIHHQVFRYPAGHGFFCDQRNSYNPEAANDAWNHVKQLFQETLV